MSTPIETNTEELQEVLQQVYNLPSRSASSNSYDLAIQIDHFDGNDIGGLTTEGIVDYSTDDVLNTIVKLENCEPVKVVMFGRHCVASSGAFGAFPAIEVTRNNGLTAVFLAADHYQNEYEESRVFVIAVHFNQGTGELANVKVFDISTTLGT